MCSGSEAGSYLRLIDYVYHSTLGLVVKKEKQKLLCWPLHSFPIPQNPTHKRGETVVETESVST